MLKNFYTPALANLAIKFFPRKPTNLCGITFPNPMGLAAGFDKNGECIDALLGLGFGFVEVGAVTPVPQTGNPKPRLFRIESEQALLNAMGFNNLGVDHLVARLQKRRVKGILGVNLGKNLLTPLENALDDYQTCFIKVYPYADFVSINISSPNTTSLRELQSSFYLTPLLKSLKTLQLQLQQEHRRYVPLMVKISPDVTPEQLEEMAEIFLTQKIDAVIATNTTVQESIKTRLQIQRIGGISGKPLFPLTIQIVSHLNKLLQGKIPIIGVGGILTPEDAIAMFAAGASLIQIYTGLIYKGPKLVKQILKHL